MEVCQYTGWCLGVQGTDVQMNFGDADERAIQVAEGILDPRTGAPRNTQVRCTQHCLPHVQLCEASIALLKCEEII